MWWWCDGSWTLKVTLRFPLGPTCWAWFVCYAAFRVHFQQAHAALEYVLLLFDVIVAPSTNVGVDDWARPVVAVELVVARMKVQLAVLAVVSDDLRHLTLAVSAHDLLVRAFDVTGCYYTRFPFTVNERSFIGRGGWQAPRV